MIELLLKSSVAIGLALVFYKLVLQQESFFSANRFYLLGCIVLAFVLPYISLPKMIEQQGYLEKIFQKNASEEEVSKMAFPEDNFLAPVFENAPETSAPVEETGPAAAASTASEVTEIQKTEEPEMAGTETSFYENLSLWDWLMLLYLFGVGIFGISLLFQLGVIAYEIITARDKVRDGRFVIVNTSTRKAPCSFFNYIFIYPDDYDFETYEQIIAHEKTHVRLRHSYDLLLAELAVITLWFNPLIWLFKKEIEKNNEYQTDAVLLEKYKVRKDQYQLNLLQIAVPNKPLNITTNYNQSLIKQRIVMMNSKKSTPHAYWKYSFMLPFFFGMLLLLNEPALAQEKEKETSAEVEKKTAISEERTTKNFPKRRENALRERQNLVERTANATIERERLQERVQTAVAQRENVQERVAERRQLVERRNRPLSERGAQVDMTKGAWYSTIKNGRYCIQFRGGDDRTTWNMSDCYDTSAFQKKSNNTFIMTNEVGTLELTGNLDSEVGQGKYVFTESAGFRNYLTQNDIADVSGNDMFHLFFGNMTKDYISFLKKEYPNVDGDELVSLSIHGVKQDEFRNFVSLFENHSGGKADIDDVVGLKIHGVTANYVQELQKLGFANLRMDEIMSAKIHGVDPQTVKEMRALGAQDIDKIIELQIHDVDAAYVSDLKSAGFNNLSMDKIISAKIHGVNSQTIKEMKILGAEDIDKIIELKIHNVTADYVKQLQNAGLSDLSLNQIVSAKIHGLNPSSIQEIRALGFENLKFNDLLSARIHGVDQAFVKDLQQAGFSNLSMNDIVSAKIHGINRAFIEDARKNGYDLNSIDKYISLKIHGSAMESLKDQ